MANLLFLLCLILASFTRSLADDVFVSIDCGASSAPYRDENGIVWTGDDGYVNGGESRSVQAPSSPSSRVMDTLRVFSNKSKNCYSINSFLQGRVLVRASFYYGNYDGKNSPPSFDLMFDGYFWGTVNTSGETAASFEVIYVTKKNSVSVCVAQSEAGQFPFMSALEIRSLESYMYKFVDNSIPLFTRRRVAFGANQTIRFPDDPFDRTWIRDSFLPDGAVQVSSDARISSGTQLDAADNPPPAVLKTAITSPTPNSSLELFMGFPSLNASFYINWYFSEVTRLPPNQIRSFYIFKDNLPFSPAILPPYDNCTQMFVNNTLASSNTTFSLVPANDSALPPLINAMEVFRLGEALNDGTNKKDVRGLASLQEEFSLLQGWSGDPCLPALYAWDWIKCSDDAIPRVTSLVLGGYGLSGLLPNFSSMDALQIIDLRNNSLRGNIPDFLGTFQNLTILNLDNNQFNGTIPVSLSTKKNLILRLEGSSSQHPPPAEFSRPFSTAKFIFPRLQLLFTPPPSPIFDFPPLPPSPIFEFPPSAPHRPQPQFQFPPRSPSSEGNGAADSQRAAGKIKLLRILRFSIPPGFVSAVLTVGIFLDMNYLYSL